MLKTNTTLCVDCNLEIKYVFNKKTIKEESDIIDITGFTESRNSYLTPLLPLTSFCKAATGRVYFSKQSKTMSELD